MIALLIFVSINTLIAFIITFLIGISDYLIADLMISNDNICFVIYSITAFTSKETDP